MTDLAGSALNISLSIPGTPLSVEGSGDYEGFGTFNGFSNFKKTGLPGGLNIGVGVGCFENQTYTIVAPPPADLWYRPVRR